MRMNNMIDTNHYTLRELLELGKAVVANFNIKSEGKRKTTNESAHGTHSGMKQQQVQINLSATVPFVYYPKG